MPAYGEYAGNAAYGQEPWEQQEPREDQYNEGRYPPYAADGDYYEGEPGAGYGYETAYGNQPYSYGGEQAQYDMPPPGEEQIPYDVPRGAPQFAYGEQQGPYGMQPAEGQIPYGMQPGEEHSPYGMQPGEAQTPYDMQPGEAQSPYGMQPGEEQMPYGMQPGEEQMHYGMQPGEEQMPYGMQPGEEKIPYGMQPGEEQIPYGMQPGEELSYGVLPGTRQIPGLQLPSREQYDEDGSVMITPPTSASRFLRKDDPNAALNMPLPPFAALEQNSVGSPRMLPYGGSAAGYAESRRLSVGTESLPPYPSSKGSTATYVGSKSSGSSQGRVTLKDRYNPQGPLEKDFEIGYRSTRGRDGRGGCCNLRRCCCITFILLLLLAGGLAAAFFLFFKQPEIRFVGVETGQPTLASDQLKFSMPLALRVNVKNPNSLGFEFNKIEGEARFKDVSNTVVGSGKLDNVVVPQKSDQVMRFPFTINYEPTNDPGSKILLYIAKNCGIFGGAKGKLDIDYTLRFSVSGLDTFGIKPAFTSSLSVDCPLDGNKAQSLFAGLPRGGGGG